MKMLKSGFNGKDFPLEDALSCVGEGWSKLVTKAYKACAENDVCILQIKEKFGGLRFYVGSAPNEVLDIITEMEKKSVKTCEICGDVGKIRSVSWLTTLCDKCFESRKK